MRVLFLFLLPFALGPWSEASEAQPPCTTDAEAYEARTVSCVIPAAAEARGFRFEAHFAGGHDDTRAAIEPDLDGRPLRCEAGSKTELFGEDGEVALYCRFTVPAEARRDARLRVIVRWSHAQYVRFALMPR